jgi:D-sedoheptulose 7-phosphate isomerase
MNNRVNNNKLFINSYFEKINKVLTQDHSEKILALYKKLTQAWKRNKSIYICGNGGSAGNANHIANDFLCVLSRIHGKGLKVESLAANPSIITCIGNDLGYDYIFSEQLKSKGSAEDLLIVLSGSGNSKNIINAILVAKKMKIYTFGILGFDGGKAKKILDNYINFKINDMQISEDIQMILLNICVKKIMEENIS